MIENQPNQATETNPQIETSSIAPEKKQKPWLMTGLLVLLILSLGTTGFFAYQNYQLKNKPPSFSTINLAPTKAEPTTTLPTVALTAYTDEKFQFSFSYPQELNLSAEVRNLEKEYQEYRDECAKPGGGCGGGPWPDYEVDLKNNNNQIVLYVRVYEKGKADIYLDGNTFPFSEEITFGGVSPAYYNEYPGSRFTYAASYGDRLYTLDGISKVTTWTGPDLVKKEEDYGISLIALEEIAKTFKLPTP